MGEALDHPVFITCRDRVTALRALVRWLEGAGCTRIHLVDNQSTYPPLLDYYAATPHTVIRLRDNLGHRAAWESGAVREHAAGEHYVVTD
ncbi:MAG TPA: glycosyltransferase family 2 protein, partial [Candidatus Dormibacteraeota bacterium]|nr:glycosyltransferase family 2 protein [Candidatus Dormibacteraeota bacterium]